MLLTICEIYAVVIVPKVPNTESITAESKAEATAIDSIDIDRALSSLGIDKEAWRQEFRNSYKDMKWHTSSAAGPNGQALWMSHIDAKAVYADKTLLRHLTNYCELLGKEHLMTQLEDSFILPQFFKVTNADPIHSKLHVIFEKGNKARIIAIGDYWTQEALNPLHQSIASILKNLVNDGTFSQDRIIEEVRRLTGIKGMHLHSLDLTAATDRLPVDLQAKILDNLTGIPNFGNSWRSVVTDRTFELEGLGPIRYKVGQPMGFKSSFPMLGLTHHIIVQESAHRAGLENFKDYVILGDDIVIANDLVAQEYMVLMEQLGLDISVYKSIISDDKFLAPSAEICKRVFLNGKDISPIPTKLLATVIENGDMFYQLQDELAKRDFIPNKNSWASYVAAFGESTFNQLALLNGLPKEMTGLREPIKDHRLVKFDSMRWDDTRGISQDTLLNYFTFTTVVEQLKRLGTILQNTENVYTTIVKAASVSKTVGIGTSEAQYLPIEDFTQEISQDWYSVSAFHPAVEAVKGEVERINLLLNQISSASGSEMMKLLLSQVVDSLKISSYDSIKDDALSESRLQRKLIQATLSNIDKSLSNKEQNKPSQLTYSIKLNKINVIWNLKIDIGMDVVISRTTSSIATSQFAAQNRMNQFLSKSSVSDLLVPFGRRRNS